MSDASRILFHPFETGALDAPGPQARTLCVGAGPGFRTPDGFPRDLQLVQGFKPSFLQLRREGYAVRTTAEDADFDLGLVLAGRSRGENELRLAETIARLRPGGLLVMAGTSTDGVAALRKRLERTDDEPMPIDGHLSKYHGDVFWLRRTAQADLWSERLLGRTLNAPLLENRFRTAPGMFSWDRVDRGSALLSEHLPADLSGRVADFGAGWGYLSACLLDRCPAITSLHLYEAEFASLEAAKVNLAGIGGASLAFHWHDLTTEPVSERFDTIVMNPPFHTGRPAEPSLGQKMIEVAAKALGPRGRLLLVANTGLPYERTIQGNFAAQREIARRDGFKVIDAVR